VLLGFGLGLGPQNSGLVLAFGGLGLGFECCSPGLAGQVLALAIADVVKLQYISNNI